jgi:hypothetical protein
MKIWSRRSEWDYSWINVLKSSAEVILCFIYEHSRYALLSLPGSFPFPPQGNFPVSALPHLFEAARANIVGPIFFLGIRWPLRFDPPLDIPLPPRLNFPFDPYRVARTQARFDPETVLRSLDDFSNPFLCQDIQLRLPPDATRAQAEHILASARQHFSSGPLAGPKRGAGARVRQAKVALKNLGALKLRQLMSAQEAIKYTEETLGWPLFGAESQWSRARKAALETLRPYHAEAAALLAAWNQKRSFAGFSYQDGKVELF